MATWKSSNIVLTQKGRQLLSFLQNADGVATITKVITGASRVPEDVLATQTEVANPKLPCIVLSKEAYDTGSILNLQVSNTELEESIGAYDVEQVGVYMSHPDIDGNKEFLYMIAQCDEGTADRMPLPQVTPITLNYALYLLHGNGTQIEVTIDATAGVPMSMFEPVKNAVETLKGDVVNIKNTLTIQGDTIINHEGRITALEEMEDLEPRVKVLEDDMGEVKTTVESHTTSIEGILTRLGTAETNISDLDKAIQAHDITLGKHTTAIEGLTKTVGSLSTDLDKLRTDHNTLVGQVQPTIEHLSNAENPHRVTVAQVLNGSSLAVAFGGTGKNNITLNSLMLGNGTGAVKEVVNGKGVLRSNGSNEPSYGTAPVPYGGTGKESFNVNSILLGGGVSDLGEIINKAGALYSDGNNAPDFGVLPVTYGGTGQSSIRSKFNLNLVQGGVRPGHFVVPGTKILVCWGKVSIDALKEGYIYFQSMCGNHFKGTEYSIVFSARDIDMSELTKDADHNRVILKSVAYARASDWIAIGEVADD